MSVVGEQGGSEHDFILFTAAGTIGFASYARAQRPEATGGRE
jgi:hypothetical protein